MEPFEILQKKLIFGILNLNGIIFGTNMEQVAQYRSRRNFWGASGTFGVEIEMTLLRDRASRVDSNDYFLTFV